MFTLSDKFNRSDMQVRRRRPPVCQVGMSEGFTTCHAPQAFVGELHSAGQRWVPIIDPVVHIAANYSPYHSGVQAGVFMRDLTGNPYVGEVSVAALLVCTTTGNFVTEVRRLRQLWPGAVHWPDFKNPATLEWWSQQIQGVNDTLPVDGIWLDMNEVSHWDWRGHSNRA